MSRYGYTTESGVEIPAGIDMIDGGGPGRSGDRFEGGGILSLLANMVARPYGSVRQRPGYGAPGTAGEADASGEPIPEAPLDLMEPRSDEPTPPTGGIDDSYTGGRVLQGSDIDLVNRLAPPAIRALFPESMLGEEITDPQLLMILNALRSTASEGRQDMPIPSAARRAPPIAPESTASGDRPEPEFGASRYLTQDDIDLLNLRRGQFPDLADIFNTALPGDPITASESLILRNLTRGAFPSAYAYSESPGSRYAP